MPAVKRACLRRVTFSSWVIWLRSAWSAQQPKDSTLKDHKHVIITNMTITTNMFIVIIVIMIILIKPDQGWHWWGKLGCKGANSQAASGTELGIKVWNTKLVPNILLFQFRVSKYVQLVSPTTNSTNTVKRPRKLRNRRAQHLVVSPNWHCLAISVVWLLSWWTDRCTLYLNRRVLSENVKPRVRDTAHLSSVPSEMCSEFFCLFLCLI